MIVDYQTRAETAHRRDQERQWARILSTGRPVEGMILLFVQKLCAAFHEFEAAHEAGVLQARGLGHWRQQLAARITRVVGPAQDHDLQHLGGVAALAELADRVSSAPTLEALAGLAGDMHEISHTLYDALEGRACTVS
jgi:hypothetical protein